MNEKKTTENNLLILREKAERKLKENHDNAVTDFLSLDLSVYEMELRMQNEELHDTQLKLTTILKEYADLFDFSPTGYFILGKDGIIEKVNNRGCEQLGIDKCQIIGKYFSTFLTSEAHQDNFYIHCDLVTETDMLQHLQCELKMQDEYVFSALIKSTVVKDTASKFKYLLVGVTDISFIKEHEMQTELALIKEKELNDLKSRFISTASHEFRTPLATVLTSTSLLEEYAKTGQEDKMKKHFMRIKSSVKELTNILEDFLSLEKIESGKIQIVKKEINLPIFIKAILDEMSYLLKKGQQIKYKHVGAELINEDSKILKHILQNLISNASKFSGDDQIILLDTEVAENKIFIKIEDNGIGIPELEQKNLFSHFFRAKNAENIQGTGLGLNIVKRYVELLNGNIDFKSEEHRGTTFLMGIPTNAVS